MSSGLARRLGVVLGAATLLLGAPARAQAPGAASCPVRGSWPTADFPTQTELPQALRPDAVRALEAFAFTLVGADEDRRGTRTDALLIIKSGAVVYERYARGFAAHMPHYVWSVTKSFTNAMVGIAVLHGLVSLTDSICRHVDFVPPARCNITVQNLLEFASGLDWAETYEGKSNQSSSVLAMLYGEGHADAARFVAEHAARDLPGETYMYSSGDSTLLAGVVSRVLSAAFGRDHAWDLLFDVIGMSSAVLESDLAGTPIGSSWLYATPRDLAKFGHLLLNDGCWDGERLLPEGWVAASTAVSEPFKRRPLGADPDDVQGRQFWLNREVPEQSVPTPWPDAPADAFAARGHWGQSITVIPSLDLVIVRTADDRDKGFDFNRLLALAIEVAR